MPAGHLVERAGEEGGGERARDVDGVEEVAGGCAGVDLVEEPHPLLGEGERADRFLLKRRHTGRKVCRGSVQVGRSARVPMIRQLRMGRRWVKGDSRKSQRQLDGNLNFAHLGGREPPHRLSIEQACFGESEELLAFHIRHFP